MAADPIILWPVITPEEIWKDCEEWVKRKGGLSDDNPNQMMAAAGADPGICSCPNCHEHHWSYGRIHKCPTCSFIYPSDWWPMYAYGCSSGRGRLSFEHIDERRRGHPYWKYGFEHPVEDAWETHDKLPWKELIGDCYIFGGDFSTATDYLPLIQEATKREKTL